MCRNPVALLVIVSMSWIKLLKYNISTDNPDKLHERQRDPDDRVRQAVVSVVCVAAQKNLNIISDQVCYN